MKHAITALILILAFPALCTGHTVPNPVPEPILLETAGWEEYRLDIGQVSRGVPPLRLEPAVARYTRYQNLSSDPFGTLPAGLPCDLRSTPRDRISMMSYLWAEMFGGFDIVAEARQLARELRSTRNRSRTMRPKEDDNRSKWNLVIACRVEDQLELAARFKNRGSLFGEGSMALQIRAGDPENDEWGLIMSYTDGGLSLDADGITLADAAEVKLVVKF